MSSEANAAAGKRVLVVEDELMIRMLLEGMLTDLGHTVAAEAGAIDEALTLAKQGEFDFAVLDVNLNNDPITPVVEVLIARGMPFVFASGYGQHGVPEAYRQNPTLQKPFRAEALAQALDAALREAPLNYRRLNPFREELRQTSHGRLVSDVDPQRRDRDAMVLDRSDIGAVLGPDGFWRE